MKIWLVILFALVVCIACVSFLLRSRRKNSDTQLREILRLHKELGYPEIPAEVQCQILETADLTPIAALVEEGKGIELPWSILAHYITISKSEFKDYLRHTDFLTRNKVSHAANPLLDGVWLQDGEIIDQERGVIHARWKVENEEEAFETFTQLMWQTWK